MEVPGSRAFPRDVAATSRRRRWLLSLLFFGLPSVVLGLLGVPTRPAAALTLEQEEPGCPGEPMGVQATGVYRSRPVEEVMINGEAWGGAYWEAGMRSYWHCHRGGQILLMWEGEGRIQNRGERVRILHRGEMSWAPPWTEHWHGSSPNEAAQWLQVSVEPTGTYWMEEVGSEDYLGNDIGITSREEFLRTGVREKSPAR